MIPVLDRRPIIVALAGPNGAGKSTFYRAFLADSGLRFVNADEIAQLFKIDAYRAAELAGEFRRNLVVRNESFIFETVFSDPVGSRLEFLREAEDKGYAVVLLFIGIDSPETSSERIAMRVLKGGHDVPEGKIRARYTRTMENLRRAIVTLPSVYVYDNSNLRSPFRLVANSVKGRPLTHPPIPNWLSTLLPAS
jgi:predicted ABC-type ATPase